MADEKNYEVKQIDCEIDNQTIRGYAYIPNGTGPFPLVLFSAGFGGTYRSGIPVAEKLTPLGIAVYTFDFRGGSPESSSDGSTLDMSVMTEAADLTTVLSSARTWEFADPKRIILFGESQGGMVSAVVASRVPDEIDGLILFYPALCIHDDWHKKFKSLEDVPDKFMARDMFEVGRRYVADIWNYDVYKEMPDYKKPVLIVHGSDDKVVPVSYSERAARTYPDAKLYIIPGAGHGFKQGPYFDEAMVYVNEYLHKIGILPIKN